MAGVFAGEEGVGLCEGIVVVVKGGYRQNHCHLEYPLWTPYWVNNPNISGVIPHSPGILMNTG